MLLKSGIYRKIKIWYPSLTWGPAGSQTGTDLDQNLKTRESRIHAGMHARAQQTNT